jgi:magnesium chelatase family protein
VLATIKSAALNGLEAVPVSIEVSITNGLPAFHIVGLPDPAVREARQRVVSALRESGFQFPLRRITRTSPPASLRKEGAAFDLPIALAVLAATGQLPADRAADWLVVGELALDGALRRVRGALAYAECAASLGAHALVLPSSCAGEAALCDGVSVWGAPSLAAVCAWLRGGPLPERACAPSAEARAEPEAAITLDDIAGQELAKRALEAAAAGGHNVIFVGPPGAGKTLLARALPGLLPKLSPAETHELTRIHSVAGMLREGEGPVARAAVPRAARLDLGARAARWRRGHAAGRDHARAPWRALPRRAAEFRRDALEALRQPMEDGAITIARAGGAHRFPAEFQLVGACNRCPCGNQGRPRAVCRCNKAEVRRYRARLSGPLLDRVDIHLGVDPLRRRDLARRPLGLEHASRRARVERARAAQEARGTVRNARLSPKELERVAQLPRRAAAVARCGRAARAVGARVSQGAWRLGRTLARPRRRRGDDARARARGVAFRLQEVLSKP